MGGTNADSVESAKLNLGLGPATVASETCVPLTKGGTGLTELSAHSLVLSNDNKEFNFLNYNPSSSYRNYILTSEPSGVPVWKSLTDIIQ